MNRKKRLLEFVIIVAIITIICRSVCTAVLPYETQKRKDCLEKKLQDLAEEAR